MRFFVRPANALDLACVAAVVGDRLEGTNAGGNDAGERLADAWGLSQAVWIAADRDGVPAALFGVAPMEDDPTTGQLWMLFLTAFAESEADGRAAFSLVIDEMFRDFSRLENVVDAGKDWALDLVKSMGFTIEPAVRRPAGKLCHRVWLELGPTHRRPTSPN